MTHSLKNLLDIFDIKLLDSIILTENDYLSMNDECLI